MSRPRKQPRCTMCTQHRWKGNSSDRHKKRPRRHNNPKQDIWREEKAVAKGVEDTYDKDYADFKDEEMHIDNTYFNIYLDWYDCMY